MSKEAVVYFSGGKDSVMSVYKARQLGYDIKCAIHFRQDGTAEGDQDAALVEAVAAAIGITDVRAELMSYSAAQETLNKEGYVVDLDSSDQRQANLFNGIKADYPNIKYIVFGIDDVQPTETIYMRKAHSAGLTAVNPFAMRYHTDFWNEVIEQELEIRLQFPVEQYINTHNYNARKLTADEETRIRTAFNGYVVGDILDPHLLKAQYDAGENFGLWSAAQTIVTNGKMFTAPVPTETDTVRNRLKLATS